ncbi:cytochrome P450 [bacterium]|nr:cytochrome P450 [bacterium]
MGLVARLRRLPAQLDGRSPFRGTLRPRPVPLLDAGFTTLRHFRTPLRILDFVFRRGGHLHYLDVPFFPPILFVRDPEVIRQVTLRTANQGDFDRDTLPTQGIARVVGGRNLLYAQGEVWKRHRTAAAPPFGAGAVRSADVFHDIERAIRGAVEPQLEELALKVRKSGRNAVRMRLEPEIQAVMLDVLVNVLFGSAVPAAELRDQYLPAIRNVIRYILVDTVANQARLPVLRLPALTPGHARLKRDVQTFEELVDRVLRTRSDGAGFWPLLTAEGPEEAIRSNVRVFLAGALEATSSYVGWAIVHLARNPEAREKAYREAAAHADLTPAAREQAVYLQHVLAESLRLNNALYFLPRVAVRDATVTTPAGWLTIPAGTHLVLATYHANRCGAFWGARATGYPAEAFAPERWAGLAARGRAKDALTFGFGHGPRVCIGKHFSEAEAFVCLTLFLRRFDVTASGPAPEAESGISTRPRDGVDVVLSLRDPG